MLFWIFVILMIVGIVLIIVDDYDSVLTYLGGAMTFISFIITAIMLVIIIVEHTGVDGYIARKNAEREVLVWQLENDVYENDNDLGKRELMTDIQAWNETIASCQAVQDDFWVGIFHADIYDQFELIPLK